MVTEKMTVHQALCEIKVAEKKMAKTLDEFSVVGYNKVNADKVSGVSVDSFVDSAKRSYQSAVAQIARLNALKAAVSNYNATTKINVGGVEYTVAQAIYMMQYGITLKKSLAKKISDQYSYAERAVKRFNDDELDDAAERAAQLVFSSDKADKSAEKFLTFISNYKRENQMQIIDPISALTELDKLQREIDEFEANVDAAIQVSNATTLIDITY